MLPCRLVLLRRYWWLIASPVSSWLIGHIVQHSLRSACSSWRCPTRRVQASLSQRVGLCRRRWRRSLFGVSWSPARMTRSDRWPMPSIVRLLGGAASSISARQGTSMSTADMVNGRRVMRYYNNSWTRSLPDIAENDRYGEQITLAESRSLILSHMRAPKFSCFLMSDRLLAPCKDF